MWAIYIKVSNSLDGLAAKIVNALDKINNYLSIIEHREKHGLVYIQSLLQQKGNKKRGIY